ncbi:MAG: hypothetical protein JAZ13_07475 [Candidatus Thiodiazotropha taylori]|nr:hypothetical protein [Candidatus Thiodiazotropha taylori]
MVISTNASANKSLAWEIEFGWRSNWVANDIYIISSIGTITIKKFSPFREKICKVKLANQELTDINYSINAIPKSLPYGTKIKYMDNCNDEKENYIYITQGDVKRGFVFTRLKECRLTKVPFWLDNLYEELDHIMIRMDNCR